VSRKPNSRPNSQGPLDVEFVVESDEDRLLAAQDWRQ
jgi:hypothetical protein